MSPQNARQGVHGDANYKDLALYIHSTERLFIIEIIEMVGSQTYGWQHPWIFL